MPVENFQLWADQLEDNRLPTIEAEIDTLQSQTATDAARITQNKQSSDDDLNAKAIAIAALQVAVVVADDKADIAYSQVYAAELSARTYTDQQIQALRDELNGNLAASQGTIDANLRDYLNGEVSGISPALQAILNDKLAEVQAIQDGLGTQVSDFDSISDQILNEILPAQAILQGQISTDLANLATDLATLTTGLTAPSIAQEVDAVRIRNEEALVPILQPVMRKPASSWSLLGSGTSFYAAPQEPVPEYRLIDDDLVWGECFVMLPGTEEVLAPAYPISFDPSRVYKVEVILRCTDDGSSSGTAVSIGASTFDEGSLVENAVEKSAHDLLTVADGTQTLAAYFSADGLKMINAAIDVGSSATDEGLHLSGSASADEVFFYVRQNTGAATDGGLYIRSIKIQDVTEVLDRVEALKTTLSAQISDVSATLTSSYYTAVATDLAISAAATALKSQIEDPSGNSLGATLNQAYYTKTETDSALSAQSLSLTSEVNRVQNQMAGNMLGREFFANGEKDPWEGGDVTAVSGHPNGATHALHQTTRNIYGDAWHEGDLRGRKFRIRGVVDATLGDHDARVGFHLRTAGDAVNYWSVADGVAAGAGPAAFDDILEIPVYAEETSKWRFFLQSNGYATHDIKWSQIHFEDITESALAEVHKNSAALSETNAEGYASVAAVSASSAQASAGDAQAEAAVVQAVKADLDGKLAASVTMRAVAGSGGAELELVAADDPVNGSASAARIKADMLTVGAGGNFIEDSGFGSPVDRFGEGGPDSTLRSQTSVKIRAAGANWAGASRPTLEIVQNGSYNPGAVNVYTYFRNLGDTTNSQTGMTVSAGEWIELHARVSTHRCRGDIRVDFRTRDGSFLSSSAVQLDYDNRGGVTDPAGWKQYWKKVQVPAGAERAVFVVAKRPTETGSNSYIFLYEPYLGRTHSGAVSPTPYSLGGQVRIHGGSMVLESIKAESIESRGVTRPGSALYLGPRLPGSSNWTTWTSFTLSGMPLPSDIHGNFNFQIHDFRLGTINPSTISGSPAEVRLLINGEVIMLLDAGSIGWYSQDERSSGFHSRNFVAENIPAGNVNVELQCTGNLQIEFGYAMLNGLASMR